MLAARDRQHHLRRPSETQNGQQYPSVLSALAVPEDRGYRCLHLGPGAVGDGLEEALVCAGAVVAGIKVPDS